MFWEIMAFILGIMIWVCVILWAFVFAIWILQFFTYLIRSFHAFFK